MSNRSVSILISRVALLGLAMLAAPTAQAAISFTVDTVADLVDDDVSDGVCHTSANSCSLRAAIMQANKISGPGATIILPAGIYTLIRPATVADGDDNGDLNLTTPATGDPVITISGAGAATTVIDANQIDRVLTVDPNRIANISGVTVRNGSMPNHLSGGGIYNGGKLTISHCTISGNTAGRGAGIYNEATIDVSQSTISGNAATYAGGGIFGESPDNGTSVSNSTTNVTNSTISSNSASFDGGGIYGSRSALFVTNSTISFNRSNRDGGGIYNRDTANIYNSTIVFNEADADADPNGGSGGGVYNEPPNLGTAGVSNIRNSVVAGNYVSGAPVYDECTGNLSSYGRNKFWEVSGCTITQVGPGNYSFLDSLDELGGLQDNGGPTQTVALVPPSDMIDGAEATVGCIDKNGSPLLTDQRGAARVAGDRCDIGAFEYGAAVPEPATNAIAAAALASLAALARLSSEVPRSRPRPAAFRRQAVRDRRR